MQYKDIKAMTREERLTLLCKLIEERKELIGALDNVPKFRTRSLDPENIYECKLKTSILHLSYVLVEALPASESESYTTTMRENALRRYFEAIDFMEQSGRSRLQEIEEAIKLIDIN